MGLTITAVWRLLDEAPRSFRHGRAGLVSGERAAGAGTVSALARIFGALDALSRACAYVAAALVVGIAALILTEIFCRTVLNISLSFAWEYSAYFLAVSIFLAAGFTLRTGGHVRVMLLSQSVPPRVAHWLDVLATLGGIVIAGWLAWSLAAFAWQSWATGSTSATIDETPLRHSAGRDGLRGGSPCPPARCPRASAAPRRRAGG